MKIKIVTILSICIASFFSSSAQIRLDPFYPYGQYTLGVGVGYSQLYGDWPHSNSESVIRLNFERNLNEWVSFDLQGQHGGLSNYQTKNDWTNGLSEYNTFSAVHIQARLCLGEFLNAPHDFFAKTIFGIYIGAGGGYMWNNITNITTKFKRQDQLLITDYNNNNIRTTSANFYLPFCVGLNLHLTRRCMFNVNYEFSYAFSDYLDGYSFAKPTATNKYNDMFSVLSFGLNFYLGRVGTGRSQNYRTRHN